MKDKDILDLLGLTDRKINLTLEDDLNYIIDNGMDVYLKKAEAKAPVGKFSRLEDALKYLNIKVDFEVEPPEDALNLNDKNLFFY